MVSEPLAGGLLLELLGLLALVEVLEPRVVADALTVLLGAVLEELAPELVGSTVLVLDPATPVLLVLELPDGGLPAPAFEGRPQTGVPARAGE